MSGNEWSGWIMGFSSSPVCMTARTFMFTLIWIISALHRVAPVSATRNITLTVPKTYTLFSGDLSVSISAFLSDDDVIDIGRWTVEVVSTGAFAMAEVVDKDVLLQSRTRSAVKSNPSRVNFNASVMPRQASLDVFDHSTTGSGSHNNLTTNGRTKLETWMSVVPCRAIRTAGNYIIRLVERLYDASSTATAIAHSHVFEAVWPPLPSVELRLPATHRALSSEVTLSIVVTFNTTSLSSSSSPSTSCRRRPSSSDSPGESDADDDDNDYVSLELVYLGTSDDDASTASALASDDVTLTSSDREAVDSLTEIPFISSLLFGNGKSSSSRTRNVSFRCLAVDRSGIYQAVLWSSRRPQYQTNDLRGQHRAATSSGFNRFPVAVSNRMQVSFDVIAQSPATTFVLASSSATHFTSNFEAAIFPCGRHVSFRYTQPHCVGTDDSIRLYERIVEKTSQEPETATAAAAADAEDSEEEKAAAIRSQRGIGTLGDNRAYRLVKERRAHGKRLSTVSFDCELFHQAAPEYCFVHYSSTDNVPVPIERGVLCLPTNSSTNVTLDADYRENIAVPMPHFPAGTAPNTPIATPTATVAAPLCHCGCSTTHPLQTGRIVGLPAAMLQHQCRLSTTYSGLVSWTVQVEEGHVIHLTFDRVRLGRGSSLWVYDVDADGDILAVSEMTEDVWSNGNKIRIDYRTSIYREESDVQRNTIDEKDDGFSVNFVAVSANSTVDQADKSPAAAVGTDDVTTTWSNLPNNTVTIVGIAICCAVVVASVGFVFRQNMIVRRLRAKQAMLTPAAYRALHAASASPGSHRRHHHHRHRHAKASEMESGQLPEGHDPLERQLATETPPPLPAPPVLMSDRSTVGGNGNVSEGLEELGGNGCHVMLSPMPRYDAERFQSASTAHVFYHSGLLLQSASTPLSSNYPAYRNGGHQHRHQHQQQRSTVQPVSPAASRWSAGGHLSLGGSAGGTPVQMSVFRPEMVAARRKRRLMMVDDRLAIDDNCAVDGDGAFPDELSTNAATSAVTALGRFYSVPKHHHQLAGGDHKHYRKQRQKHIDTQQQLEQFESIYRLRAMSKARAARCYQGSGVIYGSPGNLPLAMATPFHIDNDESGQHCVEFFSPLEKRPPVEGRDSMTGDNIADLIGANVDCGSTTPTSTSSATLENGETGKAAETTAIDIGNHRTAKQVCNSGGGASSSAVMKSARYVPPTVYHLAERRQLICRSTAAQRNRRSEKVAAEKAAKALQLQKQQQQRLHEENQTMASRGTSPMSPSMLSDLSPCDDIDPTQQYPMGNASPHRFHQSSSLSSLSDIVAALDDSDMFDFDDDEYDDYYRAVASAAISGQLKPTVVTGTGTLKSCSHEYQLTQSRRVVASDETASSESTSGGGVLNTNSAVVHNGAQEVTVETAN